MRRSSILSRWTNKSIRRSSDRGRQAIQKQAEHIEVRESGEDYANITLFERDVGGVFGRVIAHIPQLAGILNYDSMLRYGGGNLVVHKKAVKFHWSHVLSLCVFRRRRVVSWCR